MHNAIQQPAWIDLPNRKPGWERPVDLESDPVNNPPTTIEDAQLLQRIGQRDRQAYSQLYDRYSGVLYSTIYRV